jgi:uncharacterized lipoprotein YbaY
MNKSLLMASLVAAVALAACGKKEEVPPAPVVVTPAPEASAPAAVASEPASAPAAASAASM